MLLRSLKLHNIRSYTEETIFFPEGSILLAGDIGAGKSTLLLAIEFALFGTAYPDLSGEALLRKGCTKGFAELEFQLDGKKNIIRRELKKSRNSIEQSSGYIVVDGIKQDLVPTELKAAILEKLGYPAEFVKKKKNYIYRYTIYTPQEDMKAILLEDSETRLNTLRKLFNIDKYKTVGVNCQLYTKYLRDELRLRNAKTEPLEALKNEEQEVQKQLSAAASLLQEAVQAKASALQRAENAKKKWKELEEKYQHYTMLQQEENSLRHSLEQQEEQMQYLLRQKQQREQEEEKLILPPEMTSEHIENSLMEREQERSALLQRTAALHAGSGSSQRRSASLQQELAALEAEIASLPEKEQKLQKLQQDLLPVPEEKKKQLDSILTQTLKSLARNETLLEQAQDMMDKISQLHTCPVCLQDVSEAYKQNILRQENEKVARAERLLAEFRQKKEDIEMQQATLQEQARIAVEIGKAISRLQMEIMQAGSKLAEKEKKQAQWQSLRQELEQIERQLFSLQQEGTLRKLEQEIKQWQERRDALHHRQQLRKQLRENALRCMEIEEKKKKSEERLFAARQERTAMADPSLPLASAREELQQHEQQERSLAVREAELQRDHKHFLAEGKKLQRSIAELEKEKQQLIRHRELEHWLEKYFMDLTIALERRVLASTHTLFNLLFQEWFSLLLDNENIQARLDDSFYPLLEIDGYDVAYSMLSGGEKTSAALAYRLALNKVINDVVHTIRTKDMLILDEPTDGFSSEQLDKVRDVLERLGLKQIILVSHEQKLESFVQHVLRVRKEGGVSKVER